MNIIRAEKAREVFLNNYKGSVEFKIIIDRVNLCCKTQLDCIVELERPLSHIERTILEKMGYSITFTRSNCITTCLITW